MPFLFTVLYYVLLLLLYFMFYIVANTLVCFILYTVVGDGVMFMCVLCVIFVVAMVLLKDEPEKKQLHFVKE